MKKCRTFRDHLFEQMKDREFFEEYLNAGKAFEIKWHKEGYEDGYKAGRLKAAEIVANAPGNTYTADCDHEALAEDIRQEAEK